MMILGYTLLILAFMLWPGRAGAHHIETVERSLPIAEAYWQERGYSTCDGIVVEWVPDAGLAGWTRYWCNDSNGSLPTIGFSEADNHTRSRRQLCAIVVHEYGHLNHWDHKDSWQHPIMDPSNGRAVPLECDLDWHTPPGGVAEPIEAKPDCSIKRQKLRHRARRQAKRDHPRRAYRLRTRARVLTSC